MDSQVVRRRANVIAAHLASQNDIISATATHVLPMSCSNSLSSAIRRCDNRMLFARQGSTSQGAYMRQSSSSEQGNKSCSNASEAAPVFSRPTAKVGPAIPCVNETRDCRYTQCSLEAPMFARPIEKPKEMTHNFASKGYEWSPKMDVVESAFNYVVTLGIPGVCVDNINVEVNDQSLIVNGNRLNKSGSSCYHRREIMHGPYRITWPLPNNANKDNISAQIQDGLLHIMIPKLSGLRWLRKAHN